MTQITTIFRLPTMTQEKYDQVITDLEKAGLGKVPARTAHIMSLAEPGQAIVGLPCSPPLKRISFGSQPAY